MGISEKIKYPHITPSVLCTLGDLTLTHSFLVMPQYPISLLGRDLHKLGASLYIPPLASATMFLLQEVSDDDRLLSKPLPDSPRALEPDHPLINPIVLEKTKPTVASHHKPILSPSKIQLPTLTSPISKHPLEIPHSLPSTIF
jgi:hypothetical protein